MGSLPVGMTCFPAGMGIEHSDGYGADAGDGAGAVSDD